MCGVGRLPRNDAASTELQCPRDLSMIGARKVTLPEFTVRIRNCPQKNDGEGFFRLDTRHLTPFTTKRFCRKARMGGGHLEIKQIRQSCYRKST